MEEPAYIVVFVTVADAGEAQRISVRLLEQNKIACANILPKVDSNFLWNGKIESESESLLIIKTRASLLSEVTARIMRTGTGVLDEYPVDSYLDEINSYAGMHNYNHLSQELVKLFQSILSAYDSCVLALFHKVALLSLMKESIRRLDNESLPKKIVRLCMDWFERILLDFSRQSEDFYDHRNDLFLKDLAVCGLRLIPVGGAWLTEI